MDKKRKHTGGLSRRERLERISSVRTFDAVDGDPVSLVRRVLQVAGFLRYHNFRNEPEGCFRELLPLLEALPEKLQSGCPFEPDGKMEPSQALLFAFLQSLAGMAGTFNRRWEDLPYWYVNEGLGIRDLPVRLHTVWASVVKGTSGPVDLEEGREFVLKPGKNIPPLTFRTTEDIGLENPSVRKIFSVYYDRQRKLYPASALDCVTSLEQRDLLMDSDEDPAMFRGKRNLLYSRSPGFIIASPALLLREGKRNVCIRLETESNALTGFVEFVRSRPDSPFAGYTDNEVYHKILTLVLYPEISTEAGWTPVGNVTVKSGEAHPDSLELRFTLPEEFPATVACRQEIHSFGALFPAVKVYLNLDAWLYPYSWIKDFILKRIAIDVHVEGLTSLMIYNELGRVDNSKPFVPFGLGTERGAWFVAGHYELAVKHTVSSDLHIRWGKLPADRSGLYEYYRAYGEGTDNRSFRMKAQFLQDYRWHDEPGESPLFLFASDPMAQDGTPLKEAPLSEESVLAGIRTEKMPLTGVAEEEYDYTIRSKNGFIRLMLTDPPGGFGEKRYRMLFTERLLRKGKNRREDIPLNPPFSPQIERITASYHASDRIDLRECGRSDGSGFWHIYPLGVRQAYPNRDNRAVPLIYSLPEPAHLMFALSGIRGGEQLRLWFDFVPMSREMNDYPSVRWYWGDGYDWQELPDDTILQDNTHNLSGRGLIRMGLPGHIDTGLFDGDGLLWFRAAVTGGVRYVPRLRHIHTNAVELVLVGGAVTDFPAMDEMSGMILLEPLNPLPGVQQVVAVSPPGNGQSAESPAEKMVRVSEYVTHRGKAVTARDYERIVLQAFPEVALVKCFPGLDTKGNRSGVVTVVVVPGGGNIGRRGWRPKVDSTFTLDIEEYLKNRSSPAVSYIDVISPWYEEVMIRGRVVFKPGYSTGICRSRLKELCDRLIAPWQENLELPALGRCLCYETIRGAILREVYIESLQEFSVIRIVRRNGSGFAIEEHDRPGDPIRTSAPYAVFVPAREHLFLFDGEDRFGISEMSISRSFIVGENLPENQ